VLLELLAVPDVETEVKNSEKDGEEEEEDDDDDDIDEEEAWKNGKQIDVAQDAGHGELSVTDRLYKDGLPSSFIVTGHVSCHQRIFRQRSHNLKELVAIKTMMFPETQRHTHSIINMESPPSV
jgi:hypothetical protein